MGSSRTGAWNRLARRDVAVVLTRFSRVLSHRRDDTHHILGARKFLVQFVGAGTGLGGRVDEDHAESGLLRTRGHRKERCR